MFLINFNHVFFTNFLNVKVKVKWYHVIVLNVVVLIKKKRSYYKKKRSYPRKGLSKKRSSLRNKRRVNDLFSNLDVDTYTPTPPTSFETRKRYPIIMKRSVEIPEYKRLIHDLNFGGGKRKAARKLSRQEKLNISSRPKPMNIPPVVKSQESVGKEQLHLMEKYKDDPALLFEKLAEAQKENAHDDYRYDPQRVIENMQKRKVRTDRLLLERKAVAPERKQTPLPPPPKPIPMLSLHPSQGYHEKQTSEIIEKYMEDPAMLFEKLTKAHDDRFDPQILFAR